jgi:hypothetical protein
MRLEVMDYRSLDFRQVIRPGGGEEPSSSTCDRSSDLEEEKNQVLRHMTGHQTWRRRRTKFFDI